MGYSNGLLESDEKGGSGERGEQGLPGIGFKLTDDGNFDIDGKRLTDVSLPVDGRDATSKAYVDGEIGHHTGYFYHLRQSFTFYDSSGTELALSTDSITGLVTDYKHGYYKIPKSGDDNYFSTLDIKIRNNLPQSTYSALFYLYGYRNNSIMSGVDLGPILFGVDGTNYNILKYDDDDSTQTRNHTKGIIWFTSDGSASAQSPHSGYNGSIELGLRFFDKSITHFVILSRCVEGKVNLGFSSNIFNVSSTVGDVTLYFEDINMNSRKIKNLGGPRDDGDAINKKYLEDVALTLDGSNVMTGDLRMGQKKIVGLADPTGDGQATNKKYVDGEIAKVHIDTTLLLPRDGSRSMFGDLDIGGNNILSVENLVDYKDTDPYGYRVKDVKSVVNKEYLNEKFLKKDKDDNNFDLRGNIVRNCEPYYDGLFTDNDLVSKAFVQTEINKLPKPATDVLKLDGSRAMTGDLNMNNNLITNCGRLTMVADGNSPINMNNSYLYGLPNPVSNDDATNKTYVDNRDNLNLPLNGSRAMQGNLNMGDHTITGIRSSAADNAALTVGGAKATFFPLHGNRSMQGNLNMANHSIINLKDPQPSDSSYAASVNFVNNTVNGIIDKKIQESEERSIQAVQQENVFEKVMVDDLFILDDDDIHKVAVVDKDFHKINQQTYQFKIDYDSEIGYYSTRLGVNVVYLPIGYYTIVFEMYFSDKIDQDKITINALSGTLSVSKINTKKSSDHTRSVINFYKAVIFPSDDELDIDITLKNKTGQSYEADTQIFVVVYGVSSPVDNSDATTKKFVTDLLKTKAGTTYVNNELAALKKRVKVLESTVDKLQKTAEFYAKQLKPVSE